MTNLFKMERYHLLHNRIYQAAAAGIFLLGFLTADTYVPEVMGPAGGAASSLQDILNGMVYDSTFLFIFISSILALILGQEFSWRTIDQQICAGHKRGEIYFCKVVSYLLAFNLIAMLYPIAGCIREFPVFGLAQPGEFLHAFLKDTVYSFFLNSSVLLIAVMCCCLLRSSAGAVAVTALVTFVLSLYLGYGMMLGLPLKFLPLWQMREAVVSARLVLPGAFTAGLVWLSVLSAISWGIFSKCDMK